MNGDEETKGKKKMKPGIPPLSGKARRASVDSSALDSTARSVDRGQTDDGSLDSPEHQMPLMRRASLHQRSQSPASRHSPKQTRDRRGSGSGMPQPTPTAEAANVRVLVRVRPFSDKEVQEVEERGLYMQSVIDMPRSDQVLLLDHEKEYEIQHGFNFDQVFWSCGQQKSNLEYADQQMVYEVTGLPALHSAWEGINSCIFAYGQTGSGKTHTMMGDPSQIANADGCDEQLLGVIPRLCRDLFDEIERKGQMASQAGLRRKADVRVRFYEIYNEKVKDLLGQFCDEGDTERFKYAGTGTARKLDPEDLKIREHPTEGPYVEGISIHNPRSYEDIIALINAGNQERSVASTNLNDRSSRSHAIFRITVTQTTFYEQARVGIGGPKTTTHQRRANINLVDLAGSENVKRSGASGTVLIEAQKINLSLTTLRRVIDALIEKKPRSQVPYRESTLTWLLREDLGGNAKTFMMATVSPHHLNHHESLRTLEYAMRARAIVNQVQINEDETAKMIADLEKRMYETAQQMTRTENAHDREELQQQMAEAERARTEINDRLEEAASEALQYKVKLEAEKEKNMAFAFRHAVMLRAAKQRLSKAENAQSGQAEELLNIKQKMQEIGHDNMDELAGSLSRERGKVNQLASDMNQMQQQKDELEKQHAELREKLQSQLDDFEQAKQANSEITRDLQRKDIQYKTELNVMRQKLQKEYDDLVECQKQETARVTERCDTELRGILTENEGIFEEFQNKVDRLESEMASSKESHTKAIRGMENSQQQQQRYLHADIQTRDEMIDRLETELRVANRELKNMKQRVSTWDETTVREKAEALVDQNKKHEEETTSLKEAHFERCNLLKDLALKAENDAADRTKEKLDIQKFFADVAKREEKYEKSFELVCHFLDQLPDGELPDSWTLDDVRKMIKAFQKFKREYASFKPNKETLKAMLRVNPYRQGADRIKELIDKEGKVEAEPETETLQVVLGAMKCPEIAGPAQIPKGEASPLVDVPPPRESFAANYPYQADQNAAAGPNIPSSVRPLPKRRSRSTPKTSSNTNLLTDPKSEKESTSPAQQAKKRTPRTGKVIKCLNPDAKEPRVSLSQSAKRVSLGHRLSQH